MTVILQGFRKVGIVGTSGAGKSTLVNLLGGFAAPTEGALVVNGTANYGEVVENLLAFVPFGLLIAMLEPQRSFAAKLAPIAGTSLAFEVLQFVFAAGASDITDLLSNTLGGAIGLGLYASDARALRVCNGVALAGTVAVLALIGLLVGANR